MHGILDSIKDAGRLRNFLLGPAVAHSYAFPLSLYNAVSLIHRLHVGIFINRLHVDFSSFFTHVPISKSPQT